MRPREGGKVRGRRAQEGEGQQARRCRCSAKSGRGREGGGGKWHGAATAAAHAAVTGQCKAVGNRIEFEEVQTEVSV